MTIYISAEDKSSKLYEIKKRLIKFRNTEIKFCNEILVLFNEIMFKIRAVKNRIKAAINKYSGNDQPHPIDLLRFHVIGFSLLRTTIPNDSRLIKSDLFPVLDNIKVDLTVFILPTNDR